MQQCLRGIEKWAGHLEDVSVIYLQRIKDRSFIIKKTSEYSEKFSQYLQTVDGIYKEATGRGISFDKNERIPTVEFLKKSCVEIQEKRETIEKSIEALKSGDKKLTIDPLQLAIDVLEKKKSQLTESECQLKKYKLEYLIDPNKKIAIIEIDKKIIAIKEGNEELAISALREERVRLALELKGYECIKKGAEWYCTEGRLLTFKFIMDPDADEGSEDSDYPAGSYIKLEFERMPPGSFNRFIDDEMGKPGGGALRSCLEDLGQEEIKNLGQKGVHVPRAASNSEALPESYTDILNFMLRTSDLPQLSSTEFAQLIQLEQQSHSAQLIQFERLALAQ